ncbi:hypothetical protein [Micromonospora deserti]|uniref:hypothetical protein n=1 Tax=Micromonospora deserti TaxID=2070366 RepID=UPI0013145571|nr:hypothetical protein [Micromonospora deserti]
MIDVTVQVEGGDVIAEMRLPDRFTDWRIRLDDVTYRVTRVDEMVRGQRLVVVPEQ